jgi:hypothetical protein
MQQILNHPRNRDIFYEPKSHTYWYQLEEQYDGITKWIGRYKNPFDRQGISMAVARRDGKTQKEVLKEWDNKRDTSAEYGNFVHDAIERWVKGMRLRKNQKPYVEATKVVLAEKGLTPIAAEFVVFDEQTKMASPIDLLCLDGDNELVVVDMKTYEKGVEWAGYKDACMLYPLYTVPDANYWHTSIQTGWYIKTLAEKYDVKVKSTGYILYLRGTQDEINCQLIETDKDSVEMVNTLYKHEGYEI